MCVCSAGIAVSALKPLYNRLLSSLSHLIIFDLNDHTAFEIEIMAFHFSGSSQRTIAYMQSNENGFSLQVFRLLLLLLSLGSHLFQLHVILCWAIDPKRHKKSVYRYKSIMETKIDSMKDFVHHFTLFDIHKCLRTKLK